jgi:hypothetical protein
MFGKALMKKKNAVKFQFEIFMNFNFYLLILLANKNEKFFFFGKCEIKLFMINFCSIKRTHKHFNVDLSKFLCFTLMKRKRKVWVLFENECHFYTINH